MKTLGGLGRSRLIILGIAVAAIAGAAILMAYMLSRADREALYAGLSRDDVGRIGMALRSGNIPFDVSADGATVYVSPNQAAKARMALAEQGLPRGATAGYELFDKVGSLGLTTFMQEVTKLRALEGELARSIQALRGVKAARVHIVAADEGSFRRAQQPASASVVVQPGAGEPAPSAAAIRHLVAAAVPGMKTDHVTVLDTEGQVLASGEDAAEAPGARTLTLERQLSQAIQDNVTRTLSPSLVRGNFVVSVSARINTDKRQVNETIFNPDTRVERSVRVVRETQTSQNSDGTANASVERNIPGEAGRQPEARRTSEDSQKREETTNYELSSKTIATATGGFAIEQVAVAVVVNSAGLPAQGPERDARLKDIEELAASAAGLRRDRGDVIKLSAMPFHDSARPLDPVPPEGLGLVLARQLTNALTVLALAGVAALLVAFVARPALTAALRALENGAAQSQQLPVSTAVQAVELASQPAPTGLPSPTLAAVDPAQSALLADLTRQAQRAPQKKLAQMIAFDERQAAAVLRQWLRDGERA